MHSWQPRIRSWQPGIRSWQPRIHSWQPPGSGPGSPGSTPGSPGSCPGSPGSRTPRPLQRTFVRGRRQEGVSPLNPATELPSRKPAAAVKRSGDVGRLLAFHQSFAKPNVYTFRYRLPYIPSHPAAALCQPAPSRFRSFFAPLFGTLFFGSWSALGAVRGRKKLILIGSWPLQEEFQERFQPSWGPESSQKGGQDGPKSRSESGSSRKSRNLKKRQLSIGFP